MLDGRHFVDIKREKAYNKGLKAYNKTLLSYNKRELPLTADLLLNCVLKDFYHEHRHEEYIITKC